MRWIRIGKSVVYMTPWDENALNSLQWRNALGSNFWFRPWKLVL